MTDPANAASREARAMEIGRQIASMQGGSHAIDHWFAKARALIADEAASQPREGVEAISINGKTVTIDFDDPYAAGRYYKIAVAAALDTAPTDQAQGGGEENSIDLRPYGWAPGSYFITCIDCPPDLPIGDRAIGAKRSCRCETHARDALAQSNPTDGGMAS